MKKILYGILWIIIILLILFFALPPFGIWLLIPIGLALMLWVQYRVLPEKIHFIAPSLILSCWISVNLIMYYGISDSRLNKLYPIIFICLCLITCFIERKKLYINQMSRYRYLPLEQTLIWVSYSLIRSYIPMLGTAGFVSYSCYKTPWVIQPISYVGIYGLEFILVFLGYSMGMLLIWQYDKINKSFNIIKNPAIFWFKISSGLFFVWLIISLMHYFIPEQENSLKVAALQTNTKKLTQLDDMVHQSAIMGADIVVCPEGTYIDGDIRSNEYSEFAKELAKKENVYLIICDKINNGENILTEVALINPKGDIIGVSRKDNTNNQLVDATQSFDMENVFSMTFGTIGIMLGCDQFYLDTTRDMARKGAGLILVSADESSPLFWVSPVYSIFRAVENGVSIVKGETWYRTLFVSPKGNIISQSFGVKGFTSAIVVSEIPIGKAETMQTKVGDGFAWCALIALFIIQIIKQYRVLYHSI